MSRSVRIELSPRNVALLLAGLAVFGTGVGLAVRHLAADGHDHAHGEAPHEAHGQEPHAETRVVLTPQASRNAGLELLPAGPGEVRVTLALPGEVSLNQDAVAHVTPRVSGTAREVKRQVGAEVEKGDVLAILDSRDFADAQREFLATKERLALAKATFQRAEMLQQEQISAEKDFLAARQALAEAEIDHRSAGQKLKALGGGGGNAGYTLVAPFSGTIIEKHISVGEVLSEETRAFTIADLSTIWVNVTVYAKDLPRISTGQPAEVRAEGIRDAARGTIVYLGQVVGEQTRSATARIVLNNPGRAWRPGLFATAEVTIDRAQAPVVLSDDAVQTLEGSPVVFVRSGEAFEARPVKLGRRGAAPDGGTAPVIEVLDGVRPGEQYVAKNAFILKAELGKSEAGHAH